MNVRTARRRGEAGSATVLAMPLIGSLVIIAVVLAFLGGAVTTRRRVAAAADLAALAGAASVQRGEDGCAVAGTIARRNGAQLTSCAVDGLDVRVVAEAETAALLGRTLTVSARARAGPDPP